MSLKRTGFLIGIVVVVLVASAILYVEIVTQEPPPRPQEPSKPYPYYTEDITFENSQAGITLAGTLTLPSTQGSFPVAILITGSGPQNRDEEISGHKPFLIIADHLTKMGIAVLRFDDRGVGQSTGEFKTATTADFASDVASAIKYVKSRKEINESKIGLIGHSEGGMVAPLVASESEDVSFMVMLAGPGIDLVKLMLMQQELLAKAYGISEADINEIILPVHNEAYHMIITYSDGTALKAKLKDLIDESYDKIKEVYDKSSADAMISDLTKEEAITLQAEEWSSEWYRYFLKFDPASILENVSCPVLALNGDKDLQVTPKENLSAIDSALRRGGNTNVTVKVLPNLNHLFQNCETGSPEEYDEIDETFSPVALREISSWILVQLK